VKWNGYRTLAAKDGARVTLLSRNLKDATAQYPTVARAVGVCVWSGDLVTVVASTSGFTSAALRRVTPRHKASGDRTNV
jgi:hypothetical protein